MFQPTAEENSSKKATSDIQSAEASTISSTASSSSSSDQVQEKEQTRPMQDTPPTSYNDTPKEPVIPTSNNKTPQQNQPKQKNKQQQNQQAKQGKVQKSRQLANKDSFLRLSYLHQSTNLLNSVASQSSSEVDFSPLQQMVTHTLHHTSLRSQAKLDPNVKRTYCKKCHTLLIPGLTMRMELMDEGKLSECLVWRCEKEGCGAVRRFPVGRKSRKNKGNNKKGDNQSNMSVDLSIDNSIADQSQGDQKDEDEEEEFVLFTDRPEHKVEMI
ncbi:hypothetical protein WICPIJ_010144 [Wickerhamomyces pijperi]|uniref:Rpr2-domain-containing protein n=1 Tax=Wickerhamomyces pijperi TaxID=599730 RepID=A0A9P8PIF4_WICPI|nr:hypothetical protein WICPIJ_010144 [Wickerhamomyces pijperi]